MVQDVNLASREWCDLIFKGKNKQYGAYIIRQDSDKRHVRALFVVFAFVCIVITLPFLIDHIKPEPVEVNYGYGGIEIVDVPTVKKPDDQIKQIEMPKPPVRELIKSSIAWVPPKIVDKGSLTDDTNIPIMDDLTQSNAVIHTLDVKGNSSAGKIIEQPVVIPVVTPKETDEIVKVAEQQPEYPGGVGELMKFLSGNLRYPVPALEQGVEGKVTVQFVVGKTGEITNIKVLQSLNPHCDKEAVRLISSMPKWIPGRQNGRPVSVYYTIPIRFRINHE